MRRRVFIKNAGMVAASASLLPLITSCGAKKPNSLITIGMIGVGSQGTERNLKYQLKYPELCRVVAVCDVSMSRARIAKKIVDDTYKTTDCKAYQDFREIIGDRSIDAVHISTPDHWHVPISVMAALKGKHVISEKPTMTIDEGRLLCNVMKKTDVNYQVSIEDRFLPAYHQMAEIVLNGKIGALKNIIISLPVSKLPGKGLEITDPPEDLDFDLWLGPAKVIPYVYSRTFYHFRWFDAFSGGLLTDWGTHYCDTAQLVAGYELSGPVEITPVGETLYYNDGIFNTAYQFDLIYKYSNGVIMRVKSGTDFVASIRFEGETGWVESYNWNAKLTASDDKILNLSGKSVSLPTADNEVIDFLESIKAGKKALYTPESGHRTSSLLHCGNIALKLNRKLAWDPETESFDDPEAEKSRRREMRDPWTYDKICPGYKY